MALVLAIEPDLRQAAILKRIVREKVRAQLVLVDSRDAAISAIDSQIPDVILVTALLSPRDEEELVAHLKTLEGAEHLQTHTIPQLASSRTESEAQGGGLFGKFRRKKDSEPIPGCDPSLFADEISTFIDRASQLKAETLAALHHRVAELESQRPVQTPASADTGQREQEADEPSSSSATSPSSSWSSPFEWRRDKPAAAARDHQSSEQTPAPAVKPLVAKVPLAVIADEEQRRAEEEAERQRLEAEAVRQREEAERRRKEEEARVAREREEAERRRKEEEARIAREREEAERKRKEAEARAARERQEREEAERKRKEAEARAAREREEAERKRREEEARVAREREEAERTRKEAEAKAARERQEREEAERRRKEAEAKAARERQEREEADRRRKEAEAKAARERQEREEAERRRLEAQAKAERERREREEAERRRLEAEARAERERREREEAERLRLEAEAEAERAERERLEREAAERERIAADERAAREKAEAEAAARAKRARRKVAATVRQLGQPLGETSLVTPEGYRSALSAQSAADDRFAEFRDGYDEARSGVLRLIPLAMWARAERQPNADPPAPTSKDDLREIMSRLSLSPQVAGVYYPRGCRIRRVRVPAAAGAGRKHDKPLIVSRRALEERRGSAT